LNLLLKRRFNSGFMLCKNHLLGGHRPILLNKSLKQALIPSKKRSAFSNEFKNQKIFLDKNQIENFDNNNSSKILLLDDVLTTGKTSSNNKKKIAEYLKSDNWDLLTIFRSIQNPKA
ncbi:MAG: hypothetical protein K2X69_13260, partial [Silvanigrellaceae bacterium]|nr:hypothetical protein [Silvanigrellaceae bacterium]